jgi:hypothetical protein
MFRNRFVYVVVALALLILAALNIRTAVAISGGVLSKLDLSDYGLRHPNSVVRIGAPDLLDYALRHPELLHPEVSNLSDYALRHPELMHFAVAADLSDWYLRHPELRNSAPAPDLSDYALRHPELMHPAAPDLSDWYLRHRVEFTQ